MLHVGGRGDGLLLDCSTAEGAIGCGIPRAGWGPRVKVPLAVAFPVLAGEPG